MLTSGDFADPESRIEFTDSDLERLDMAAKNAGLKLDSVCAAKRNTQKFEDQKFHHDALTGLERLAGELVVEMMDVVESGQDKNANDPEEAQIKLLTVIFPQLSDLCKQLRIIDPEVASQSIRQFRAFLVGPPNRRTKDGGTGLLALCLSKIDKIMAVVSKQKKQMEKNKKDKVGLVYCMA
jgi:hypothetical protein